MTEEAESYCSPRASDFREDKYRFLLETINEAVFEVDAEGIVNYISSGIQKITGYAPEDVAGQPFIQYVHEADRQRLFDRFAELADGIVRSSEYRIVDKYGQQRWVETFSQPRYVDDRFVGLVGVMTDIHQRKLLEEESERRKHLLEAILNSTADGIIAFDRKGCIQMWNRRFEEMWGLSGERIGGMQSLASLRKFLADQLADDWDQSSNKPFDWGVREGTHTLMLKGERTFEVISCPLTCDGFDDGLVWNFRDITSAKQAEAALLRSEEKFSKLFHASPIWSELVTLEEGRFIEVNQAFLDVSGFMREEVIGATSLELGLWPEDLDRKAIVTHFDEHHRLEALPCRFRMHDGQTRHFLWSAEAVTLEGRRCLISSLLDVTVQHRMQQALLDSEERYRSLYNNIPVGLFRTTPKGDILSGNPALVRLFGYDSEKAFLNQSSVKLYSDPETRRRLIADLDRDGSAFLEAVEFRRQDDSTFWGTLSAIKIVDRVGRFLYLDGVIQDVTERVLAERALRESESKYRLLVDNAHDGIFIAREGRIRFANPSTCRILGYTLSEMMALSLEKIIHPKDVAMVMARHEERLGGAHPPDHYTFRALRKTGETIYLELQAIRVDWEEHPSILCIVRDITSRQKAEAKLLEEKRFSETVINSLPGVFYLIDEEGRLCRWNKNMEVITGLPPEALRRTKFFDWYTPEQRPIAAGAFEEVFETGSAETEVEVSLPGGRKVHAFLNGQKLTVKDRSYLLGVGLNISKQKKMEAALRESEARFRNLVEKIPFGICIAQDGRIIYRNPSQEEVLGPLDQEVLLEDAPVAADDLNRYINACRHAQETGEPVNNLEVRFYPYDKPREPYHLKWMHCSIHPIDYRGQEALLISMVDLTRMKELEKQVLIREKMASLGHIAAGIAHEVRNPLSGINVLLEGIRENFEEPGSAEEIKELLNATQQASDKIAGVIRKVLDFSKPSPVRMEPLDINAPARDAIQLTQLTLRPSGIVFEQSLAPHLPRFYGDHQLIEQVVLNLINNAVAAMDPMTEPGRISVGSWQEGTELFLCIADSGPGVPEELKEHIFTPFFTTSNGSGIGLSFCQRVVSDHGGRISVGNSQWGGAEFRICLPLEKRNVPR